VGARYEVLHREARRVGDEPPTSIATRLRFEVTESLAEGGRRMRARLVRTDRDEVTDASLTDAIVTFDLSASGELIGAPQYECGDPGDMRLERYLRHVLGARAIVARNVSSGSRWHADYLSDATELPTRARFRLEDVGPRAVRGRLTAAIATEEGDIGDVRVTGEGHVRGRFTVSLDDGFSGTTDLRSEVEGTIVGHGTERRGVVRTRSRISVRRAGGEIDLACVARNPDDVTQVIRDNLRPIQRCYEQQLRVDPELHGRVLIRFTVDQAGRLIDGHVSETDAGLDSVATCIVGVVERLRVGPSSTPGSIDFGYPFVFSPQR